MRDSTFSKRAVPKKRAMPMMTMGKDMMSGMVELKRQMGSAVSTVKAGAQKVKDFMRGR